jgi:splicing suppressor protein 51
MPSIAICVKCNKVLDEAKFCAKCNSVVYCSKKCQKDDWKFHKKECSKLAAARANDEEIDESTMPERKHVNTSTALKTKIDKPYRKLKNRTWLHGRAENDVYKLLIDSYRFRKSEELKLLHVTEVVDVDPDVTDGMAPFIYYIRQAEEKGLLPPNWTRKNEDACVEYALNAKNWSTLHEMWVELGFITHYGDPMILAQLAMLANQVLGGMDDGEDMKGTEEMLEREVKREARR